MSCGDYVFRQLETKLSQHLGRIEGSLEDMRRRKAKLEEELRNLTSFVAGGTDGQWLRQGITEREAEISALTAQILGGGKNSVHSQIRDLRKRVAADLGICAHSSQPATTRRRCAWSSRSMSKKS